MKVRTLMPVADEFQDRLRAYVRRHLSLDELFAWLASHVEAISQSGNESLRELDAQIWLRIDDIDEGTASEDDLRSWMSSELGEPAWGFSNALLQDQIEAILRRELPMLNDPQVRAAGVSADEIRAGVTAVIARRVQPFAD